MKKLEEKIGYQFKDQSLLSHALRHSSYLNEHHMKKEECNERLEFLGDAILEMVSSEFLYKKYPFRPEGELSKLRASLVCEPALAAAARSVDLGSYLILGKGMEMSGGRESESITSDALEALIAAILLDSDLEHAKNLIFRFILNDIEEKVLAFDAKTALQEILQSRELQVTYETLDEKGPEHDKEFTVSAVIGGKTYGTGVGKNKKQAQQAAALETIRMIRNDDTCI